MHDQVIKTLKEALQCDSVLTGPDYTKIFVLETDASDTGIGVVLSQDHGEDKDRSVAYFSQQLKKAEKNYVTVE